MCLWFDGKMIFAIIEKNDIISEWIILGWILILRYFQRKSNFIWNFFTFQDLILYFLEKGILNEQFCKCFLGASSECITSFGAIKAKAAIGTKLRREMYKTRLIK